MKEQKERRHKDAGFTLVEILLVVVIIGILAAVGGPKLIGWLSVANEQAAAAGVANIKTAITSYQMLNKGKLPNSLQELTTTAAGKPPPLEDKQLNDPWGNAYQYTKDGSGGYTIVSAGEDGQFGTADDVK